MSFGQTNKSSFVFIIKFDRLAILTVYFHPCSLQDGVAADFTALTKTLYDLHKAEEPAYYKGSPLSELVVENFDEEQIWQELELQNNAVLKHFKTAAEEALSDETITLLEKEVEEPGDDEEEDRSVDEEFEEEGEPPRLSKNKTVQIEEMTEDYTDEDSDLDFDVDALEKREKLKKESERKGSKPKMVPSKVDDKFFKLSEMESFLDEMDKQEGKEKEDEDDVDYFQDVPSDEDDNLDLDEIISSKKLKKNIVCFFSTYTHFFYFVHVIFK